MAEVKIEITDEMIMSAVRDQVRGKMAKIDIKSIVNDEIAKLARESWNKLDGSKLVKEVNTSEIAHRVANELTATIVHAFDD